MLWGISLHAQLNPQAPTCLLQKPDSCPGCLLPSDTHSSAVTKPSGLDRLYTFRLLPWSTPSPSASAGSCCLQPCVSPTHPQAQGTFLTCQSDHLYQPENQMVTFPLPQPGFQIKTRFHTSAHEAASVAPSECGPSPSGASALTRLPQLPICHWHSSARGPFPLEASPGPGSAWLPSLALMVPEVPLLKH